MDNFQKFEEALMGHLSDFRLNKDALKTYSASIVELRKKDILIDWVWKYGMPGIDGIFRSDGVGVRSHIPIDQLEKLNDVFNIRNIHSIEIFPLGIINPELLEIRFKLGDNIPQ